MPHGLTVAVALAATGHTFHIGPWIIIPLLLLAALIGAPIYIIRDRHRRRRR